MVSNLIFLGGGDVKNKIGPLGTWCLSYTTEGKNVLHGQAFILRVVLLLILQCAHLQAHNCQIESKYLMILRKLQGLPGLTSDHVEMVKELVQEALEWDVKEEAMVPVQLRPIK